MFCKPSELPSVPGNWHASLTHREVHIAWATYLFRWAPNLSESSFTASSMVSGKTGIVWFCMDCIQLRVVCIWSHGPQPGQWEDSIMYCGGSQDMWYQQSWGDYATLWRGERIQEVLDCASRLASLARVNGNLPFYEKCLTLRKGCVSNGDALDTVDVLLVNGSGEAFLSL